MEPRESQACIGMTECAAVRKWVRRRQNTETKHIHLHIIMSVLEIKAWFQIGGSSLLFYTLPSSKRYVSGQKCAWMHSQLLCFSGDLPMTSNLLCRDKLWPAFSFLDKSNDVRRMLWGCQGITPRQNLYEKLACFLWNGKQFEKGTHSAITKISKLAYSVCTLFYNSFC